MNPDDIPAIETPVAPDVDAAAVKVKQVARDIRAEARKLRDMTNLTINEIAKKAGVSSTTVSKATNPELEEDLKLGTLVSVLNACGGDIEFRITRNGDPLVKRVTDIDIL